MDKKKLVILISSIVIILLLLIVGLFLVFAKIKKTLLKPNDEEVVKEENVDKFKEVDFDENMKKIKLKLYLK